MGPVNNETWKQVDKEERKRQSSQTSFFFWKQPISNGLKPIPIVLAH